MPKSKEFISSSEDSDAESDQPKPKKKKVEAKQEKSEKKAAEKGGGEKAAKPQKNKDGEYRFQISKMRFATVSEFRGKVMVGIREFYEADGDLRPGKKGITLTMDQWNSLKNQIDEIDEAVKTF